MIEIPTGLYISFIRQTKSKKDEDVLKDTHLIVRNRHFNEKRRNVFETTNHRYI